MATQLTTRAQVNGYRFLLKRLEHALVRRDVRMLHDPMSTQFRSLIIGLVLAAVAVGGCAILAFIRPQGSVGDAKIVMGSQSGALYVVAGKSTLQPALNLASARLITGSSESPTSVKDAKLGSMSRGPILGIPGAPAALPSSAEHGKSTWTLCDTVISATPPNAGTVGGADDASSSDSDADANPSDVRTTVFSSPPALGEASRALSDSEALLVSRDNATYLVYGDEHAKVDTTSAAVAEALQLQGVSARPAEAGLLNATIAVPDLTPPTIPGAGQTGAFHYSNLKIGTVIKVVDVNSTDLYVIVADGVQHISPFAAEMIRDANSQGISDIITVPPDALSGIPVVDTLPIDRFPTVRPKILSADEFPVACVAWARGDSDAVATLGVLVGRRLPLAADAKPVTMVTAGAADHVDDVYVPPSSGEFVQTTGIEPDSTRRDSFFFVGDNGIRYGIPDTATAAILGLSNPRLAPYQIVGQLVPGPMLDRADAMVAHDSLPQDQPN